jgi:carbamoyltransferase
VDPQTNPRFYRLISRFKSRTSVGVVVNTSFNVRGEPIVCTPKDAFRCLMGTALDLLVIENIIVRKEQQNPELLRPYYHELPSD